MKRFGGKSCAHFGVLFTLSMTSAAYSHTCSKDDLAQIEDPPFHLAYGSWVEPRDVGARYVRCVEVLNGQAARIDWRGTQARGSASRDRPVRFEFDTVREATEELPSRLEYGVNKRPERARDVNFLANIAEVVDRAAMVEASVSHWKLAAIAGESIPKSALAPTSSASLGFEFSDRTFYLTATFTSYLDVEDRYLYELRYSLEGEGGESGLSLRPRSEVLLQALLQSGFDKIVPIAPRADPGEPLRFALEVTTVDPLERRSTQYVTGIEVLGGEDVVAVFPVTYYAPAF